MKMLQVTTLHEFNFHKVFQEIVELNELLKLFDLLLLVARISCTVLWEIN